MHGLKPFFTASSLEDKYILFFSLGSGQLLYLMRNFIEEFEKEHGEISKEDISEIKNT